MTQNIYDLIDQRKTCMRFLVDKISSNLPNMTRGVTALSAVLDTRRKWEKPVLYKWRCSGGMTHCYNQVSLWTIRFNTKISLKINKASHFQT